MNMDTMCVANLWGRSPRAANQLVANCASQWWFCAGFNHFTKDSASVLVCSKCAGEHKFSEHNSEILKYLMTKTSLLYKNSRKTKIDGGISMQSKDVDTERHMVMDTWQALILGCVETHVDEEVTDNEIIIEGYNLVKIFAAHYIWLICVEIETRDEKILLNVFYHPPQTADNLFLQYLEEHIEEILDYSGKLILTGDFNLDFNSNTTAVKLKIYSIDIHYIKLSLSALELPIHLERL
ncbi:hypothetical protein QE152_g11279 [Popillia japonica]|uniref:Endonuclease/exonuclease/phosphatase domain-containing protein n=1 Tax=Popillia japonica TaxID=7064 RepID=A0AAW1LSH3_POPJA